MNDLIYPHKEKKVIRALEEQLEKNKHKGNTWQMCNHIFLLRKLTEEYAEVMLSPNNYKEFADLSNISNMLLWRYAP